VSVLPLRAEHVFAFSYRRSVGGATQRFLGGLAEAEIWGSRAADGRVFVPPVDHDPETGAAIDDYVRVGEVGVVRSWTWVDTPSPEQPLDGAFAYALVQLEGADTALLHLIDVADEHTMATGMRVRVDWRAERVGSIRDIRAFVPVTVTESVSPPMPTSETTSYSPAASQSIEVISDVRLEYTYEPGLTLSAFLRSLAERRIVGGRCPVCMKVYVPPRPRCPTCRAGPMADVALGEVGVVTSYTIVHVPFAGLSLDLPFVTAWIRLDGADVPFPHLLGEVVPDEVRVGQRVEAVWVSADQLEPSWESIRYFRPVTVPLDSRGRA
jgi:uncharacterized protein